MAKKILISTILPVFIFGVLMTNPVEAKGFGCRGWWVFGNLNLDDWAQRIEKMFENWAKILGISIEKVKNYWSEGKTIKEMMKAENISQEDVQKRINELKLEELKSQLQKLVEKGIITQQLADKRLEFMKNQLEKMESKNGFKRFNGRFNWFWLW